MEFNEILRRRRIEMGFTQAQLGDKVNLAESTISLYESGKRFPDKDTLKELSKVLQTPISILMGETVKGFRVPVLGNVPAGIPLEAITDIIDYEEISPTLAACGEYFALRIKGDSMAPRICDGDVVIVKKESAADSGDVAIVMVNGNEATCKEILISDAGVTLIGWNVAAFSPMFFTKEDVEKLPVKVIGRVVEVRIKNLKRGR